MKKIPNNQILTKYFKKYNLTYYEQEELLAIITNIYIYDEFQRRLTKEFYHHDNITLGEHILNVTIITYKKTEKY